jgi:hypothetical protein
MNHINFDRVILMWEYYIYFQILPLQEKDLISSLEM